MAHAITQNCGNDASCVPVCPWTELVLRRASIAGPFGPIRGRARRRRVNTPSRSSTSSLRCMPTRGRLPPQGRYRHASGRVPALQRPLRTPIQPFRSARSDRGQRHRRMDVACVVLMAPEHRSGTAIAAHALNTLSDSSIGEVVILGRRGPRTAASRAGTRRADRRPCDPSAHSRLRRTTCRRNRGSRDHSSSGSGDVRPSTEPG